MGNKKLLLPLIILILSCLTWPARTYAANDIVPGQLVIEPPTLHSLGFEWNVTGDDNRNAEVTVEYRKAGTNPWKQGLFLFRMNGEIVAPSQTDKTFVVPNKFAGSIFDLDPDTSYDVRFTLIDTDGGNQTQQITTSTKSEPQLPVGGTTMHLYPTNFTGTKLAPSFTSFQTAYTAAQPGDTIFVHSGTYLTTNNTSYKLTKVATFDKPIVIHGEDQTTTIFDGVTGNWFALFTLSGATHHIIENLTFKNAGLAVSGIGQNITIRNSHFQNIADTILCKSQQCKNFTVTNNYLEGRVIQWTPRISTEAYAIGLAGSGHDVSYNTITNYWDGIDTRGPTPSTINPSDWTVSIDIYNNKIFNIVDDCMETDYGVHNIRVYRNFCYNVFQGISTQPFYGGPDYIFRNVVYNSLLNPLKFNVEPAGILVFNNTFIGRRGFTSENKWSNSQLFNNLFIGSDNDTIDPVYSKTNSDNYSIQAGTVTPQTSQLDYNGYRINNTASGQHFWWTPGGKWYPTLSAFSQGTGLETHGITLDYSAFESASQPSGRDTPLPQLNLQLKPGSVAIDHGVIIPNITDNFTGSAPDLGAYEIGSQPPLYGYQNPTTKPGDANGDGNVNVADLLILLQHYSQSPTTPSEGNFNTDTKVSSLDYGIWIQTYEN